MRARLAAIAGLSVAFACAKPAPPPSVHPAASDTVQDNDASFDIEVGWRSAPPDEVELVIELIAKSIEQTDNLVVDIGTNGFVISEGTSQWTGYIQPRERYKHTVTYKILDDADSGRATVTLRRSMDGTLLWSTELLFRKDAGGVQLAE